MGRTAAVAVAVVLAAAGAVGPAAAGDTSDDRAQKSADARADRDETPESASREAETREAEGRGRGGAEGDRGRGDERGDGHTPVTVCHVLGNGGYIELTFDDNALDAHQAHGDLYPVPADGCPESESEGSGSGTGSDHETGHTPVTVCHVLGNGGYIELTFDDDALDAHQAHGDLYPVPADGCPSDGETTTPGNGEEDGSTVLPGDDTTTEAEVLGVQELAGTGAVADAEVAGAQQAAAANRAATGPLAGILPQTGAAPMALAGAAGLALLVLGGTVLARRRSRLG